MERSISSFRLLRSWGAGAETAGRMGDAAARRAKRGESMRCETLGLRRGSTGR
jgi:hypothetical protein